MPDDRVSVIVSRSQLNVWVEKWKVLSECRTTAVRAYCDESESHSTRTGGHMCVSVAFNMIRRVDRKPAPLPFHVCCLLFVTIGVADFVTYEMGETNNEMDGGVW